MGILGIGVDVVHVSRIARLTQGPRAASFARRILSEQEHQVWEGLLRADLAQRVRFLAVRFSVKESAYKAVFPFLRPTWKDFTFHSHSADGTGKPLLEYHSLEHQTVLGNLHASVSHDGEYVFTTVLAETP